MEENPCPKRFPEMFRSKDEEIAFLRSGLRQKESEVSERDRSIRSLEETVRQKGILITEQWKEIARLRGIENSLAWRGIRKLFVFVETVLAPAHTARGKVFTAMLNRLKAYGESRLGKGRTSNEERAGGNETNQRSAGGGEAGQKDGYSQKIAAEINAYRETVKVHDLPPIHRYWAEKFLMPKLRHLGIQEFWNLFVDPVSRVWRQSGRPVEVASLGAGNCDFELEIARQIARQEIPFRMHCYEVNPAMLDRGKEWVQREGLLNCFRFVESDINRVSFDREYGVFIANHSLHHFVNLEHIFESIRSSMRPDGYFVVNDMIGRNGHMLWPEAYEIFAPLWASLDMEKKWNHQNRTYEETYHNWDYSVDGFEGIRAQDILPLLIQSFNFELFCAFNNITDLFIGRCFGHNFKPDDPRDQTFIDDVTHLDETSIREGKITPTHLIAWMVRGTPPEVRLMDGLTPEKCVRDP
jgi:SAM-dependent methyltransferase